MSITHIYPKMPCRLDKDDPPQKRISEETAGDVWDELRDLTFDDEPGKILVLTHEIWIDPLGDKKVDQIDNASLNHFVQELERDDYRPEKIAISKTPVAEYVLVSKDGKQRTAENVFPFNLGRKWLAQDVIDAYRGRNKVFEITEGECYCGILPPIKALVLWFPDAWSHLKYLPLVVKACPELPIYIFHDYYVDKYGVEREGGQKEDYTFSTLPEDEEEDVLEHLLAKFALTMMPAPSYTGKTHTAISMGLSLVTGEDWLGKFKAARVPVRYFVPELSAGRFKKFMRRIAPPEVWLQYEDRFIVRPLDCDLLMLDSQEMIEKCRGFYVFLDTLGYFMGMDDNNSYAAAIEFAKRINHLIKEGCLGVCGLYHPPKYSKNKKETGNILTLENQILGSAGFGGLLRSCIALRNLNQDSNEGLWCYVQGLKNPGLGKPFQIKGFPMEYLGESPYLSELLKSGSKKDQALVMLAEGKGRREICKTLKISSKTLSQWKQEDEELEKELQEDENGDPLFSPDVEEIQNVEN